MAICDVYAAPPPLAPPTADARAGAVATRHLGRALDVVLAAGLLVLALPLLAVAALAIALDSPGPVLFRQRRLGRDQRPFTMLKLRTMRADADPARHRDYVHQLIETAAEAPSTSSSALFKLATDDRITRVGRVLRRTSIDELPQMWNVLCGGMSLVGPRPVLAYEVEKYPRWYLRRFAVRPGLTGLWQVSGRNERTYEEMIVLDIAYAEGRSLSLDLVILIKTVGVVLRRRGVA